MWCHLLTLFDRRYLLRFAAIILLCVAFTTTLFFASISHAAPGANQTIGFQGRLLDSEGDIVPDGYYNVQFKIYEGGSGLAAGNPDGDLKWTETYVNDNNATGAVQVTNGFLSVNLGSENPFGSSVDWDANTLWLSMNVAGKAVGCTTFGSGACADDGEMLPMKRLTASPYALNAGAVNGKTAAQLLQLAQGVQTDASANTSSIFINKTNTGNLIQLQNTATDIFTVTNSGNVTLGSNDNKSISIDTSGSDADGRQLSLTAGAGGGGSGSNGGDLTLQGGAAGGTNGNGGNIVINAGSKTGTGTDGVIAIGTANTGSVTIGAGDVGAIGSTTVQSDNSVVIKTDGVTRATFSDANTVYFGNGVTAAAPNDYTIQGTNSSTAAVAGGSLTVQGGSATVGDGNGGNIILSGGAGSGAGANGLVVLNTPTFSTVVDDANCYDGGANVNRSCTLAASTVNNSAAVIVGFSATGRTATVPAPTITTAGRILYVTASNDSEPFSLEINSDDDGTIAMRKNTTVTLLWNGSNWTSAGASASSSSSLPITSATIEGVQNVQVGDGVASGSPTLLTVDKAATAPTITDEALLGSMYYDTTKGELQCYEAEGWGSCSSSPDTFVSLSPEYSNAVINGTAEGEMTSDFCSSTLVINFRSHGGEGVCAMDETFNYYKWTSNELEEQTKSIFVTYKLPSNFKEFVAGSTSLYGLTDSSDANVKLQVYKKNSTTSALVTCAPETSIATGDLSEWHKETLTGISDPSDCEFSAGDSIIFKVNLSAAGGASAYASTLDFAYSIR